MKWAPVQWVASEHRPWRVQLRYEGGVLAEISDHVIMSGGAYVGTEDLTSPLGDYDMEDLKCLAEQILVEALDADAEGPAECTDDLGKMHPTEHICPAPWGGSAISRCYEMNGKLWVDNGEYMARVNYCPCCGFTLLEA